MYIGENIRSDLNRMNLEDLTNAMQEFEASAGVPVRMLKPGQNRTLTRMLGDWQGASADMSHYPNHTETVRDNEGITILIHCTNTEAIDPPGWVYRGYEVPSRYFTNWEDGEAETRYMETEVPGNATAAAIEAAGGIPLILDGGDFPYAEMYEGRVIYLRIPPYTLTNYNRANWHEFLFGPITENMSEEAREEARQRRQEQEREVFSSLMIDQGNQELESLRGRIDEIAIRVADGQERLVADRASYNELNRQLAYHVDNGGEMSPELIQREWDALIRHTKIKHFTLGEAGGSKFLKFYTDFLYLDHPRTGRKVPLGEYEVTLDFGQGYIRVRNKTQRFRGWDHPHIEQERICAGEFATTLTTLLRERKLAGLSNILFAIFNTLTMDDSIAVNNCEEFIAADNERRRQNNWPAWTEGETEHPMVLAEQEAHNE